MLKSGFKKSKQYKNEPFINISSLFYEEYSMTLFHAGFIGHVTELFICILHLVYMLHS